MPDVVPMHIRINYAKHIKELAMSETQNWREQRAALVHNTRNIMGQAEAEGRELTGEEREQIDRMMDQVDSLRKDIERSEAADAEMRDIEAATDRKSEMRLAPQVEERAAEPTTLASAEYRNAFDSYLRNGRAGMTGDEIRALQVGTNSEGGFLSPVVGADQASLQSMIMETVDDSVAMMGLATVVNVSGDITIPTESTLGAAAWTAEEGAYNESDAAFGQVTLTPYKATTLVKVSEELLADSAVDLSSYLGRNFGRRFANLMGAAFANGDGSSKPTGVSDGSTKQVDAAGAAGLTFTELIELYYALKEPYRKAGTWMFNSTTAKEIRSLKDSDGQYIWQASVQANEPDTLLGRPVAIDDDIEDTAANNKSVLFGDMSYYWIAMRQGVTLRRLDELYAGNGQVGMIASVRVDGELTLSEAIGHIKQAAS